MLRQYDDLSWIQLKILPDGLDGENQYEPEVFTMLSSIETVADFFRTIVLQLFRCLKFSSGERRFLVAKCLGVIGAIDPKFLGLVRPSLAEEFYEV